MLFRLLMYFIAAVVLALSNYGRALKGENRSLDGRAWRQVRHWVIFFYVGQALGTMTAIAVVLELTLLYISWR